MRQASAREHGFTLPELSVAILVLGIVSTAILTFVVVSAGQFRNQDERVSATDEARTALLTMTSEIRDAGSVRLVDARTLQAEVRQANNTTHLVTYSCVTGTSGLSTCSRTDPAANTQHVLADDVTNTNNFAVIAGSPTAGSQGGAVQIRLALDLDDAANPLVLTAAATPRNCAAAGAGVVNPPCA